MLFARYAAKLAICCPFALLCYLPLSGFLRLPLKKLAAFGALGVTAFVGIGALACCRFQLSVNVLLFPALLLFLLLYLKSVVLPPSKALFVFFTATMLVSFSATLSCYLCAPLELHNDQPVFTLPSGLIGLALTFAVLLVFSLLFRRKIHWMLCNVSFSAIWRALFVAPLFLTGLFIWMTPIYPAVVLTGRVREISIVLLISFLSLLFWFYYFVYLTTRKMSEAAELHAQNQLLSMENTRYRELREHMDATRQLRHDFRQHLAVIRDCADRGDLASLKNYLNDYENMFPIQEVRTYCKNYAVNAILSFYAEKAEKNGISMQVTIQMADPPVNPETEFCVLVGNLLEHAVDACADTDAEIQSFIRLHVVQTGSSMLSITADNTSSGSPNWSGDKLLSTKHSGYGIGTESIRMIAERYSGDARFRWKDGIFYASVMLNPQV